MNRSGKQKKMSLCQKVGIILLCAIPSLLLSCSFDYGDAAASEDEKPDIVMERLEYIRVRGGDPLVRFRAELAERWEDRQIMDIKEFSFEQMEDKGDSVNVVGRAGAATVQLDSGNVILSGGVRISVESEDIIIQTFGLEWKDKEKVLSGEDDDEVDVERSDGTTFTGKGFYADARNWTWTFSGEVKGTYVEPEDEEETGGEAENEEPKDDEGKINNDDDEGTIENGE